MSMRTVRQVLATLVAVVIALKFVIGSASPQAVFAFLVLTGVLVLFPAMMIDGETRLERAEVAVFVATTAGASCWLLTLDGGASPVPWLAFGVAWLTGLGSYSVAVRVKRRNGSVVSTEVLEALAGWPAMRQFNTSVTAPAAAPDLRPPDLRGSDLRRPAPRSALGYALGSGSIGDGMTWRTGPADPGAVAGSARRRLREQGWMSERPVRRAGPRSAG